MFEQLLLPSPDTSKLQPKQEETAIVAFNTRGNPADRLPPGITPDKTPSIEQRKQIQNRQKLNPGDIKLQRLEILGATDPIGEAIVNTIAKKNSSNRFVSGEFPDGIILPLSLLEVRQKALILENYIKPKNQRLPDSREFPTV
jgi:hypothetical protein